MTFFGSSVQRDAFFLVLALTLVSLYVLAAGGGFPLDDSWIHQTYGRNLAQSGEWAFLPGQPSAASTAPLYTVLLAIGYRLNVPYMLWTHFLGALALALTAMTGTRLAERLAPDLPHAPLMTGLALLLTWHLLWAAASGMETMLFGLFSLLVMLAVQPYPTPIPSPLRREGGSLPGGEVSGLLFGILVALMTLTRPEGILLAGIIGLVMLITRPQGNQPFWRWTVGAVIGFVVFIAPYLILNLQLTGGLLPNTAAAKFEQHAILLSLPYPERLAQLFIAIIAGGQVLLLPGIVFYGWQLVKRFNAAAPGDREPEENFSLRLRIFASLRCAFPLFWIIALIGLYAAWLPAAYQHGRYVIPALPALVLTGTIGTLDLLRAGRKSMLARVFSRALAGALVLLYGYFVVQGVLIYRVDVAIIDGEMVTAAKWIRENLPENELLAIHDIGAVGYFAPRPMLDIAGLISPEVIPIVANPEALWALMRERDARYLLAFPNQIPGRNPADARLCPIYTTNAAITQQVGEANMTVYRLAWDGNCAEK